MANSDRFEMNGEVVDITKGMFVVKLDNGHLCNCTLGGKLRVNSIKIIRGDSVSVDISPYDVTKGRIIYRNK